jgi:hypothetical protein
MMGIPDPPPAKPTEKPPAYKQVTRYDLATGRILGGGQVDYNAVPDAGQGYLDGRYSTDTEYLDIDTDVVEQQQALSTALATALSTDSITLGQTVTLAPPPIPCTVRVDGLGDVAVDDGSLEVTPESIGSYRLVVDEVAYLRESYFFDVVDP